MPMLSNPMEDLTRPKMQGQFFIGIVVNNVDEDDKKQRQRVQIRIPQRHRGVPDAMLPWAIPDTTGGVNNMQVQSGSQVGNVNIPPIGSKVWVRFEDNDPHNPRYAGSPSTDDVAKNHEAYKENYPHTRMQVDPANNREAVNVEKMTKDSVHSSGTTIHIDANGTMSITTAGDFNIGVNGKINMVASGEVNINGSKINLNEGSKSPTAATPRPRPQPADPANREKL